MGRFDVGAAMLAIAASVLAGSAHAQTAPASDPQTTPSDTTAPAAEQDIIVTAQKSGAQRLQDVPLAIQAFSGEDLKQRNINTIDDLVSSVPGAYEGQRQSVASRS
jgi:outer membrane receptor protein involved in Fe transport